MQQTRWIVQFADPEQLHRVPAELLKLATRAQDASGHALLLLRDSLSAYKIASQGQGRVCRGTVHTDTEQPTHATRLTDGAYLVLEQATDALMV